MMNLNCINVDIIVFVWSQLDGGKVEPKNNGISFRKKPYDAIAK